MKQLLVDGIAAFVCAAVVIAGAQGVSPEAQKHIDAARAAAATDHMGLFQPLCDGALALAKPPAPRGGGPGRGPGRQGGPPPPPARETWHAEPVKVFDNMYYVGMTEYSSWAITTSQGIILLDAIYDYSIEDEVVEGLKTLGLNPADIKYVIVAHGHLDHAGGAKYLQEKYGARLIMSAADYDLLDQQNPPWKPKRDMVATDGMKVTLGDTTLTLVHIPGHTPGTMGTIVPVKLRGTPHSVIVLGATQMPTRESLLQFEHVFNDYARPAKVEASLNMHANGLQDDLEFLEAIRKNPDAPNPYLYGPERFGRWMSIMIECGRARLAALGVPTS